MSFASLPPKEGIRKGVIVALFLYVVYVLLAYIVTKFLDATQLLREIIIYLFNLNALVGPGNLENYISIAISIIILLPAFWLLGHVNIKSVMDNFSKIKKKIFKSDEKSKFLFCVRMKDKAFFGGYPIGLVTQIIRKDGKVYYHTWWPGIMHWTLPFVPEEDVVRCEESVSEVLSIYISGGTVSL